MNAIMIITNVIEKEELLKIYTHDDYNYSIV